MNFNEKYEIYLNKYLAYEKEWCDKFSTNPLILGESMKYSLRSGGKKIRPVMMLASADMLNVPFDSVLPFCLALEMIHTYSLIHDDLPAMDNDDFRRGKPSNHKAFGEDNAILAGDGLLNTAGSILFNIAKLGTEYLNAGEYILTGSGVFGMLGGQSLDLKYTNSPEGITEDILFETFDKKTGKLLQSAIIVPSILKNNKNYEKLIQLGKDIGLLFQVTDDILDTVGSFEKLGKTVGKDKDENKMTSVSVFGFDGAVQLADNTKNHAIEILKTIDEDTSFFKDLVDYIRYREK